MTDEERKARIHHHMYTTCETPAEHAERIVKLEELCHELYTCVLARDAFLALMGMPPSKEIREENEAIGRRMDELGIPRGQ